MDIVVTPKSKNKSLSARVKRRNAQGFVGVGNHYYIANECGNYLDYHKSKNNTQFITMVKKLMICGKHAGSKPVKRLKNAIAQLDRRNNLLKQLGK